MLDAQDKKRADEWAAREAKIKNAMDRMAGTVLKKSNAAEKELEARVIKAAAARDQKLLNEEQKKKEYRQKRDADIKTTLDKQLREKRELREAENVNNKKYIDMVLA